MRFVRYFRRVFHNAMVSCDITLARNFPLYFSLLAFLPLFFFYLSRFLHLRNDYAASLVHLRDLKHSVWRVFFSVDDYTFFLSLSLSRRVVIYASAITVRLITLRRNRHCHLNGKCTSDALDAIERREIAMIFFHDSVVASCERIYWSGFVVDSLGDLWRYPNESKSSTLGYLTAKHLDLKSRVSILLIIDFSPREIIDNEMRTTSLYYVQLYIFPVIILPRRPGVY